MDFGGCWSFSFGSWLVFLPSRPYFRVCVSVVVFLSKGTSLYVSKKGATGAHRGRIPERIQHLDPNLSSGSAFKPVDSIFWIHFWILVFLALIRALDPQSWIRPFWEIAGYD